MSGILATIGGPPFSYLPLTRAAHDYCNMSASQLRGKADRLHVHAAQLRREAADYEKDAATIEQALLNRVAP